MSPCKNLGRMTGIGRITYRFQLHTDKDHAPSTIRARCFRADFAGLHLRTLTKRRGHLTRWPVLRKIISSSAGASSNVFISTNIDYVLRNLEVRSLIVAGMMTDQCVESAVRDACDLGYLVTLVTDACTTDSAERQGQSLIGIRGYCRQRRTDELLAEIAALNI